MMALSIVTLIWGSCGIYLMNKDPLRLVIEGENHPSRRHMCWIMMVGHLGLAGAYLIRLGH
jgi:hypothetical protein